MTRDKIGQQVLEFIKKEYELDLVNITESDKLYDLGIDSLDMVALWMPLEEMFKIDIPEHEIRKSETVGQLLDLLEKHVKKG